jgi:acetate---CoA ligase (ADP-forming)
VIFASLLEPPGLADRLQSIAREAGMVLCGGNGMGFFNLEQSLRVCGYPEPADLPAGPVAVITHSGSVFSALLHNDRGLRFNLVVSAGNELVTSAAAYLDHALELPTTRVAALFLETVREPAAFRAALAKAASRSIPVVVLKVGRGQAARAMVAAHSGALAGSEGAYQALFDAYGVAQVATLDELADTCELLAGRRAHPGGLATIGDSGGERAHLLDLAEQLGVPFAEISEATRRRLAAVLEPGLPPTNPLDAWGTGNDADAIFATCIQALLEDPATARLRAAGVPVLEGTATGLSALGHLLAYRDFLARDGGVDVPAPPSADRDRWRERLGGPGRPLDEVEGLALLADYGVPVVAAEVATTLEEALAAAGRIGWPVALKTAAPGIAHKSDVGGVLLGLDGPERLAAAYAELTGRLGSRVTVAAMAGPGVELALGVVDDPQFGPLVMVAAGGVLVEVLRDRRFALPPVGHEQALAMLDRLAVRPLLDGVRGARPAALDAVAGAIVRLSGLALDLGPLLAGLDVNPLVAGSGGCVAADALVVAGGA